MYFGGNEYYRTCREAFNKASTRNSLRVSMWLNTLSVIDKSCRVHAFELAIHFSSVDIIKLLFSFINISDTYKGFTDAFREGDMEILLLLYSMGMRVDDPPDEVYLYPNGTTQHVRFNAILYSCLTSQFKVAKWLHETGTNTRDRNALIVAS